MEKQTPQFDIGFIIEQALGHVTHTKNLQANLPLHPDITPHWILPGWQREGLAARIPVYKTNWTLQAGLQARQGLRDLLSREKPDALFFHTQVTATLNQRFLKRVPSVVSLDATPLQYDRLGEFYQHDSGPTWAEQFKWRLNRDCYKAAHHLVTWSDWAKEGLVEEYEVPPEKVTVIPPGVITDDWEHPAGREVNADGPTKILFVGGNLERKGGLDLINAFRAMRAEAPNVELHLVTRDQVDPEEGLFVYNNMTPNSAPLKKLYHDSDIFALPTYGDCLPMVLSEAGAAGLPVISTEVAAIPEIVQDDKTGYIVPTGDPQEIKSALQSLVSDPQKRHTFGQEAIEQVKSRYDAQANASKLLELLKVVANSSTANETVAA